jgi:hypothetical protein
MVITNIEMTTQYLQDKTSHIHTHTSVKWHNYKEKLFSKDLTDVVLI